jgi:hypothetical protein
MLHENASSLKFYNAIHSLFKLSIEDLRCNKIPSENHAICNDTDDIIDFPTLNIYTSNICP